MNCPKCSLFNEPNADFCDCGYPLRGQPVPEKVGPITTSDERLWGGLVLAAGLLVLLNTYLGVAVVFVLWIIKRKDLPNVDTIGKNALNYWFTVLLLNLVTMGAAGLGLAALNSGATQGSTGMMAAMGGLAILTLIAQWAGVVFSIIGLVKWSDGKFFKFPGAIPFLR